MVRQTNNLDELLEVTVIKALNVRLAQGAGRRFRDPVELGISVAPVGDRGGWEGGRGVLVDTRSGGRFKKSLSMSGEVGSLAGDRVVSHERSRPADLPRQRHSIATREALSFGFLWLRVLECSSGTRSSLPGVCDVQRCKFDFMH